MCGGAQGGSPCLWKAVGGLGVGWWVMRSFDGSFGRDRRSFAFTLFSRLTEGQTYWTE